MVPPEGVSWPVGGEGGEDGLGDGDGDDAEASTAVDTFNSTGIAWEQCIGLVEYAGLPAG